MSSGELTIVNSGLIKLGIDVITDFDEDSKAARLSKVQYPVLRDELQRSHPWNFTIKRASLPLLATAPLYGYKNAFQLPTDLLRVLPPSEVEFNTARNIIYKIEGRTVVTDEDNFNMRYISRVTDTNLFDSMFKETLAYRIAADFAYPLVNRRSLSEHFFGLFAQHLALARSADAMEETPERIEADLWLNARHIGTSGGQAL